MTCNQIMKTKQCSTFLLLINSPLKTTEKFYPVWNFLLFSIPKATKCDWHTILLTCQTFSKSKHFLKYQVQPTSKAWIHKGKKKTYFGINHINLFMFILYIIIQTINCLYYTYLFKQLTNSILLYCLVSICTRHLWLESYF